MMARAFLGLSSISLLLCSSGFAAVPDCRQALANLSLTEVGVKVHGGDSLHPTPESRLGQYLQRTGAASFIHRFKADPAGAASGPEKLVVLVSPETFPAFAELFGTSLPNVFEHLHTPRQGTLLMRWMDRTVSYAVVQDNVWRFPTEGSIGPMILLSDAETRRLNNYFDVTVFNQNLRMPNGIPGFSYPVDHYIGNCTAWIGHIPVGDRTVNELTVPGNADGPANTHTPPQTGRLTDYNVDQVQGLPPEKRELFRQVWNANLPQPLFETLGVPLSLANHTNPGWVALSLTGLAPNDRVPFVVLYTADHKTAPANFDPQINPVGP